MIQKRLLEAGLDLRRLIAVSCDSTAVNPAAITVLQNKKHELIQEGIGTDRLEVIEWSNNDNYYAFTSDPTWPMPKNILFHPDVTHALKNAELKSIAAATEHFVCEPLSKATILDECKANVHFKLRERYLQPAEAPAAAAESAKEPSGEHESGASSSKEKPEAVKNGADALMTVARLMGLRGSLLDGMRWDDDENLAKEMNITCRYEKMPGEVAHRFNIKTKIADVLHKFYPALVRAFELCIAQNSGIKIKAFL